MSGRDASGRPEAGEALSIPREGEDITRLLHRLREGDREALDELLPLVYSELHRIARRQLGGRRRGREPTLDTTAIVHEAFLKMAGVSNPNWNDRVHFFAVGATAMRQVLTDYARRRSSEKRGGDRHPVPLDDRHLRIEQAELAEAAWLVDLDRALSQLAELSGRMAKVVECRFFGGMTDEEIGGLLDVTPRTVRRDWTKARAWLRRELGA